MVGTPHGRPAGWYRDPENPSMLRHWDSRAWAAPRPGDPPPPRASPAEPHWGVWVGLSIVAVLVLLVVAGCFAMVGIAGGMMNQGL